MKKRYSVCAFIALLVTACALDGGNLIGPAGGFVFFDKGSYSDKWRYLECAPENAGTGTWDEALRLCAEYSHGGYDDWFLPDRNQLEELLNGGLMFEVGVYWSSSASTNGNSAWGIQNGGSSTPDPGHLVSGGNVVKSPDTYGKGNEYWARPVRKF